MLMACLQWMSKILAALAGHKFPGLKRGHLSYVFQLRGSSFKPVAAPLQHRCSTVAAPLQHLRIVRLLKFKIFQEQLGWPPQDY